jgi:hypothetical protein
MWRSVGVLAWLMMALTAKAQELGLRPTPIGQNPSEAVYAPGPIGVAGAGGNSVLPMPPPNDVPPGAAVPMLSAPVEFPRPVAGPSSDVPWAPSPAPALVRAIGPSGSMWYTRIDYFHWNERIDGQDFVNESGALITVGYQHRFGRERVRLELFGNNVDYDGSAEYPDGTVEPLKSVTNYVGMRAEYDLLIQPGDWQHQRLLLGVGTRIWARDLPDARTASGGYVDGYQELWWTIYPYLGAECEWPLGQAELFVSGRFGATPVTLQHVSSYDATLYPKCGIMGTFEGGVRWTHLSLSAYLEAMNWSQSAEVRGILQPNSTLFLAGMKIGWAF